MTPDEYDRWLLGDEYDDDENTPVKWAKKGPRKQEGEE